MHKKMQAKNHKFFEYKNILNTNIDVYLYNGNIVEFDKAECLVNCTGPHFQSSSKVHNNTDLNEI